MYDFKWRSLSFICSNKIQPKYLKYFTVCLRNSLTWFPRILMQFILHPRCSRSMFDKGSAWQNRTSFRGITEIRGFPRTVLIVTRSSVTLLKAALASNWVSVDSALEIKRATPRFRIFNRAVLICVARLLWKRFVNQRHSSASQKWNTLLSILI